MTTATIIIDTWDNYHPGHDWLTAPMQKIMLRISEAIYNCESPVVLSAYQTDLPEPNLKFPWKKPNHTVLHRVEQCPNHIISWDYQEVKTFLQENNVTHIRYMGFSVPGCILNRELGYINMSKQYKCSIVADCVLNLFTTHYYEENIIHDTYKFLYTSGFPLEFSEYIKNKDSQSG